jgi:hydroxyacylglutathione hydrolase
VKELKTWETKNKVIITRILSGRSNVFLISKDERNILVDTGIKRKGNTVLKRLNILNIHKIDILFLTHSHFDHTGNAQQIVDTFNCRPLIRKEEIPCIKTGSFIPLKGTTRFTKIIIHLFLNTFSRWIKFTPFQSDPISEDYFEIRDLGFKALILHTPGHTPGSASLLIEDEIALVGDTLFGVFPNACLPPYAADEKQMLLSWGKLLDSPCCLFLPSHGSERHRDTFLKAYQKRIGKNGF